MYVDKYKNTEDVPSLLYDVPASKFGRMPQVHLGHHPEVEVWKYVDMCYRAGGAGRKRLANSEKLMRPRSIWGRHAHTKFDIMSW